MEAGTYRNVQCPHSQGCTGPPFVFFFSLPRSGLFSRLMFSLVEIGIDLLRHYIRTVTHELEQIMFPCSDLVLSEIGSSSKNSILKCHLDTLECDCFEQWPEM